MTNFGRWLKRIVTAGGIGVLAVSVASFVCACGEPQVTSQHLASSPTAPRSGNGDPIPPGFDSYPPTTMAGPFPFGQNPLGPGAARYPSLDSVRGPIAAVVARLHAKARVFDPAVLGHDLTYYFNGTALAAVRSDLTIIEQTGAWLGGRGFGRIFIQPDGFQYGLFTLGDTVQLSFGQDGTIVELLQPAPTALHSPSPDRLITMAGFLHASQTIIGDPKAPFVGYQPNPP